MGRSGAWLVVLYVVAYYNTARALHIRPTGPELAWTNVETIVGLFYLFLLSRVFVFVFASQGKQTNADGSTYDGEWKDDKQNGKVRLFHMRQKNSISRRGAWLVVLYVGAYYNTARALHI